MKEQWRKIPHWPYEASSEGRIRRLGAHLTRRFFISHGYLRLGLHRNGASKTYSVHSLVAKTFLGPRPHGHDVDHINDNRTDNRVTNLRYLPVSVNRTMLGETNPKAKLTKEDVTRIRQEHAAGSSTRSIAKNWGISKSHIWRIVSDKVWRFELEGGSDG